MRRVFGWLTLLCFALALLFAASLLAQPAQPAPLTEIEALRVQNLGLERVIIERQVSDWQAKQARLKESIEQARPGWVWSPDTGAFAPKEKPPTEPPR